MDPTTSTSTPHPQPSDPEKATPNNTTTTTETLAQTPSITAAPAETLSSKHPSCLAFFARLTRFETRGIARVHPSERDAPSRLGHAQMALLWFSANATANNLAVGLMGPLVFGLGFKDAALCAVIGAFLGAVTTAYMGIWGARSGLRTMVVLRFFMGYYPAKICCLLNIVLMIGYGTIDCIIGAQILAAVSNERLSIAVGVIVVALAVCLIAVLGLPVFHLYERIAWLPQLLALFALIASAHPHISTTAPSTSTAINAARLSFLTLALYVPNSWAAAASDFYVTYAAHTPPSQIFALTLTGLVLSFTLVNLIGIALGTGVARTPAWEAANARSTGALLVAALAPLGSFGSFCSVLLAAGGVANAVPGTYSAGLGCGILAGRYGARVPRWAWAMLVAGAQLACGLAGREGLFAVFENVLPLMGYWVTVMVAIVGLEHGLFRRGKAGLGGRVVGMELGEEAWEAWEVRPRLPLGVAATVAFVCACAAAVTGMCQEWFVGPLARLAGPEGADVGMWVACAVVVVVFPPLRVWEVGRFAR